MAGGYEADDVDNRHVIRLLLNSPPGVGSSSGYLAAGGDRSTTCNM